MRSALRRAVFLLTTVLGAASATQAQPVSLSPDGIGQVLIYPYYTARAGWLTLLSIVNNDSANGKAVKVRFLEGKNGAPVASLNVFLAPDDLWTGAVVPGSTEDKGAQLVSNDDSCTYPSFRPLQSLVAAPAPSLEFSNQSYIVDGDTAALQTIDRTREGYVEVIEMASIPLSRLTPSAFMGQIYAPSASGYLKPPCTAVTDADLSKYTAQVTPPSGGLSGAATLLNIIGGASAEYTPTALNGFWLATAGASATLTPSASVVPNLGSGGNITAQYVYEGKTYYSRFNRSIDAVSATLMSNQLMGEHAFTQDGVISTSWVIATPTKRFYTQGVATPPFAFAWSGRTGNSCDDATLATYDRNSFRSDDDACTTVCPGPPPLATRGLCQSASLLSFGGYTAESGGDAVFKSKNLVIGNGYFPFAGMQNGGKAVLTPGNEGGKTRLIPSSTTASLTSASGSITSVDLATGAVSSVFGSHTLYGLPMIGVALTLSSFKTGNPQQNYASGFRLQSSRRITSP